MSHDLSVYEMRNGKIVSFKCSCGKILKENTKTIEHLMGNRLLPVVRENKLPIPK